jgi:hypothetical protein
MRLYADIASHYMTFCIKNRCLLSAIICLIVFYYAPTHNDYSEIYSASVMHIFFKLSLEYAKRDYVCCDALRFQ